MTIAIIIAGGSGNRMNTEIPKQFIKIIDKPVLVYTLEDFEKHNEIDEKQLSLKNQRRYSHERFIETARS